MSLIESNPSQSFCGGCKKENGLCVCDAIDPISTGLHVLLLQHPQEPDKSLGSAWIAHRTLSNSTFRIGLSWPNLGKALGVPAVPKEWGILYLGSAKVPPGLHFVDPKGKLRPNSETMPPLKGIVLLDGTWSQAKSLWWRNAWLLKLRRMVLTPRQPSLYGRLRREPRRESVSTLEATGQALVALGESDEVQERLLVPFRALLTRAQQSNRPSAAPLPK
jgi:DTW domain-containing protein